VCAAEQRLRRYYTAAAQTQYSQQDNLHGAALQEKLWPFCEKIVPQPEQQFAKSELQIPCADEITNLVQIRVKM